MQDEEEEFDEIKQALSEQKEINAAMSDSIEEQKKYLKNSKRAKLRSCQR